MEHCQHCHLHSTTLRHKEDEYLNQANSYITVMLETAREAGVHARMGVARYGTSISAMGPPPKSAAALQERGHSSPGGASEEYSDEYEDDTEHPQHSPGPQASSPGREEDHHSDSQRHHEHEKHDHCVTTAAGQDLEHADKPLASLSPNLRGFMPQRTMQPPELRDTTNKLTTARSRSPPRRSHSPSAKFNPYGGRDAGSTEEPKRRLGAFEILVLFRPHVSLHGHGDGVIGEDSEDHTQHTNSPTGGKQNRLESVKMELLHSKLASQKWPSRSVLQRRFKALLGRFEVPATSTTRQLKGDANTDTDMTAVDITMAEYPDFHGQGASGGSSQPSGAMRVSALERGQNILIVTHATLDTH